jgi:hypothetical protein
VSEDYLWNRQGPPDPDVTHLEERLARFRTTDTLPAWLFDDALMAPRTAGRHRIHTAWIPLAFAATLLVAIWGLTSWSGDGNRSTGQPWAVERLAGAPRIGSHELADAGRLRVGEWLETDATGRARIDVGAIGRLDVEPATRLRLVQTGPGHHRLALASGTVHAFIWAPPGQFFVETPSATAIDLGCAYTLTVDANGTGTVRVTSGWVGFEWRGRESFIPAGSVCVTRRGMGPGTPYAESSADALREPLGILDTRPAASTSVRHDALSRVLEQAGRGDAVTLWHLLQRGDAEERGRVFDRFAEVVPAPVGVTRAGVIAGDHRMLDRWWDALGLGTAQWWRTWRQPWRDTQSRSDR